MQEYSNRDLMAAILDVRDATASGFTAVNGRLDAIEGRMTGLEGRMTGLEGRMNGLERRMDSLESNVNDGFDGVNIRLERLEAPRRRGRGPA